jgi:hypothetical protein
MLLVSHDVLVSVVLPANEPVLRRDTILLCRRVEYEFARKRRMNQQDRMDERDFQARDCELEATARDNPQPLYCGFRVDCEYDEQTIGDISEQATYLA